MLIPFTKMHALGNDFVVLDAISQSIPITGHLIQHLANRHYGVGCDQVLIIHPPKNPEVDFFYQIFNADGNEVGQCGNGARCIAHYIALQDLSPHSEFLVETLTRRMTLRVQTNDRIQVEMGQPEFIPPTTAPPHHATLETPWGAFQGVALDLGNPHMVLSGADVDDESGLQIAHFINQQPSFPKGVNVGFIQEVRNNTVFLRVVERGAGLTKACGSGAASAFVAANVLGLLESTEGIVSQEGGDVTVSWATPNDAVWLMGTATLVFTGHIPWPDPND